jgi:RNA polymerase sigma-70 factor, ECF subfamily
MGWSRSRSRGITPDQVGAPAALPDAALAAAAQRDPRAFIALYERYVDRVYAYCHARLGGREAAEDATGEVFTKALAAIGRYEDVLFAAWLFRIAHNVVIDSRRRASSLPLDLAGDRPDPARGPDEAAIAATERAALAAALARLPLDERAVVELPYAGWTGEEIAAQLGRSPAAVKQLRFRAMKRLRALLSPAVPQPEEARNARTS